MKKTLLSTALLLGALAAPAFAGTEDYCGLSNLSGSLGAGYSNYYTHQNLAPTGFLLDSGAMTTGASLTYRIPEVVDVVAAFSHTDLDPQNLGYGVGGEDFIHDANSFFVGLQGEKYKGLTTTFGYALEDGGIAGMMADLRKATKSNGAKSPFANRSHMEHQVRLGVKYQCQDSGLFLKGGVSYSFNGTEGWLMDVGLGYKWEPSDRVSFVLAGDVSFSQGYMTILDNKGYGQKLNGIDGYSISLAMPIQASKRVTVTPYIAALWAGHNGIAFSKYTNSTWGSSAFKNFAPIAGVCVNWNF